MIRRPPRSTLSLHDALPISPGVGLLPGSGTTAANAVKHIDYIARKIGVDHVGIGVDADMRAPGYAAFFHDVAAGLLKRNYGRDDIVKILGGNFLRVLRASEPRP